MNMLVAEPGHTVLCLCSLRGSWCSWNRLCLDKKEGGLGFRNLENFNRALLAKQSRRIIKQPDSLVARTLKDCYFKHSEFIDASYNSSDSFV